MFLLVGHEKNVIYSKLVNNPPLMIKLVFDCSNLAVVPTSLGFRHPVLGHLQPWAESAAHIGMLQSLSYLLLPLSNNIPGKLFNT